MSWVQVVFKEMGVSSPLFQIAFGASFLGFELPWVGVAFGCSLSWVEVTLGGIAPKVQVTLGASCLCVLVGGKLSLVLWVLSFRIYLWSELH